MVTEEEWFIVTSTHGQSLRRPECAERSLKVCDSLS